MADQLQLRGGTTSEHSTFTGALREVTVDTDKDTVVVHDNSTAGGHALLREDLSNLPAGTIDNADINANAEIAVSKLADGAARQLLQTDSDGTGVEWTSDVDVPGTLDVTGAATLDSTLDVTGLISADGKVSFPLGTAALPSLYPGTDTNTGIYSPGADQVAISTGGTGRLFVNSAGAVDVSSANARLYVTTTGTTTAIATLRNASHFYNINLSGSDGALTFYNGSERLRITSDGKVGVGTSSPSELLHCVVTGDSDGALFERGDASGALRIQLQSGDGSSAALRVNDGGNNLGFYLPATSGTADVTIDSSGRLLINTDSDIADIGTAGLQVVDAGGGGLILARNDFGVTAGNDLGYIRFMGNDTTSNAYTSLGLIQCEADGTHAAGDNPTRLTFSTTADNASSPTERMRIDSSGRVGIGTSSLNSCFEINSAQSATSRIRLKLNDSAYCYFGGYSGITGSGNDDDVALYAWTGKQLMLGTNATERVRIDSSGRLGLGTSSPVVKLHVTTSINDSVANIYNTDTTNGYGLRVIAGGTASGRYIAKFTDAANNDRMWIGANGRVGIGTTSPSEKLHLADSGAYSKIRIAGNSTSAYTEIYGDNVGNLIFSADPGNSGSSSTIRFTVDGPERARIDSGGHLLVGTSSSRTVWGSGAKLQIESNNSSGRISLVQNRNEAGAAAVFSIGKSRGTTNGSNTIVQNGDTIGTIAFVGADGTDMECQTAFIQSFVDGTPGSNDMPGRLVFSTTADGASSPTERMRIKANGIIDSWINNQIFNIRSSNATGSSTTAIKLLAGTGDINGGTQTFYVLTKGDVYNQNNVYAQISDIKFKENVVDSSSQWSDIKSLRVRNFNFMEGNTHTQIGLIAQEVELVSPGLVDELAEVDEEGNALDTTTKTVKYSVLYMKAVKALQEAMERIETLEAKVAALEA